MIELILIILLAPIVISTAMILGTWFLIGLGLLFYGISELLKMPQKLLIRLFRFVS